MNKKRIAIITAVVICLALIVVLVLGIALSRRQREAGVHQTGTSQGETVQPQESGDISEIDVSTEPSAQQAQQDIQQHTAEKQHTFREEVIREATCTREGEICYTCTDCGYTVSGAIAKKEHTLVTDAAKEPTCQHTGLTEGSHCSICGETIAPRLQLPIVPHRYENGVCVWCGAKQSGDATQPDTPNGNTQDPVTPPTPGENELEIDWMG